MSTSSTDAIHIRDLHTWYGESHILHGINVDVKRGEVVTLLGRNGAGRTTTLRALMGLTGKRTGAIRVNDTETIQMAPHQIARLGAGDAQGQGDGQGNAANGHGRMRLGCVGGDSVSDKVTKLHGLDRNVG